MLLLQGKGKTKPPCTVMYNGSAMLEVKCQSCFLTLAAPKIKVQSQLDGRRPLAQNSSYTMSSSAERDNENSYVSTIPARHSNCEGHWKAPVGFCHESFSAHLNVSSSFKCHLEVICLPYSHHRPRHSGAGRPQGSSTPLEIRCRGDLLSSGVVNSLLWTPNMNFPVWNTENLSFP